jgi:DNA-binding GntR family transcriptional regulator
VGELLPSEPQLSQRFGVSRHTVRSALQTLQRLGLVSSQQGVGTQVAQTRLVSSYSLSFSSAEDLLQFATATSVRMLDRREIEVDAGMALKFGCKRGEHWWRVRTVRSDPASRAVLSYSEIHIPLVFGAVLDEAARSGEAIFALIERHFQETIQEIQQEIACVGPLSSEEAAHLKVSRKSPGMEITRRYIGRNGRVLEVARSVHPGETFRYSMRVQLRHGSGT